MRRLTAAVPGQNVTMIRVCCEDCAHRVAHTGVVIDGQTIDVRLHAMEGAGRACDLC